jgi:hypothetical protein
MPAKPPPTNMTELPKRLKRVLKHRNIGDPQLSALLAAYYQVAGGAVGVAKLLHKEFEQCKDQRIRINILRLIFYSTKQLNAMRGNSDDLGLLSEEDLEKLGAHLFHKVQEAPEPIIGVQDAPEEEA